MIIVFFILTVSYLLLIGGFIFGFNRLKSFTPINKRPSSKFSIIIPFRNEVENLESLIQSLEELNYPKYLFEVILVNDHSNDNSEELALHLLNCTQLDFHIFNNISRTNSPKKDAITLGINNAKYEWIVTTDADCIVPPNWLNSFDAFISETQVRMIVAPVNLKFSTAIFDQFQTLDVLSLQGVTAGSFGLGRPFLCNGANLCYSKELFISLSGFDGNDNIASGDDIFLLEKTLKFAPKQVMYLKSRAAIVETNPEASFSKLIQQRIRWAAKTSSYSNFFAKVVGLIVLIMNAIIVCSLLLTIFGLIVWWHFIIILLLKQLIDYSLISRSAKFFNRTKALNAYFFSSLLYPFVSVYIAIKSVFSNYQWKGRTFKK